MTVGQSTIAITGTVEIVSSRRKTEMVITQSVAGLEAKGPIELNIGSGESKALPLDFSTGVDEALFLAIYAPKKVVVRVTGKDVGTPGPIEKGLKGYWIETFSPGEGVTAVTVTNPSTTEAVTIEYAYAAKADPSDDPEYWTD